MIWLPILAAGAGIGWLLARMSRPAPAQPQVLSAAQAQSIYGMSPYAGDVGGSSIYATGLPSSMLAGLPTFTGLTGQEMPLLPPASGLGALIAESPYTQFDPYSSAAYAEPTFVPNAVAFAPAPTFAQQAPQPIAVLRCATDCWVRPQPVPWDDRMGRQAGAFRAPRGHVVQVLSFGPAGWAHVLVDHPDDGRVDGWIETRSLDNGQPAAQPPMQGQQQQQPPMQQQAGQGPQPQQPQQQQGMPAISAEAYRRTAEFLARRGQTLVGIGSAPGTATAGQGSAFAAPTVQGRSRRHRSGRSRRAA